MAMIATPPQPWLALEEPRQDDLNFEEWLDIPSFAEEFNEPVMTQMMDIEHLQSPTVVLNPPDNEYMDSGAGSLSAERSPSAGPASQKMATNNSSPYSATMMTPSSTTNQDSDDALYDDQDASYASQSPISPHGDLRFPELGEFARGARTNVVLRSQSDEQAQLTRPHGVAPGRMTSQPSQSTQEHHQFGWTSFPIASTGAWTETPVHQQASLLNTQSTFMRNDGSTQPTSGDMLSGFGVPGQYPLPLGAVPGYAIGPTFMGSNTLIPQMQFQQQLHQQIMHMPQYYPTTQDSSMALLLPQYQQFTGVAGPVPMMYRAPMIPLATNVQWQQDNAPQGTASQAHQHPAVPEGTLSYQPHNLQPADIRSGNTFISQPTLQVNAHQHQSSCQHNLASPTDESEYGTDFSSSRTQLQARTMPLRSRHSHIKTETGSNIGPTRSSIDKRKGGRQVGKKLEEDVRAKSHKMRKTGACWGCRLQRDECDDGKPCNRCVAKVSRVGATQYFECDRSKLPDFVHDFLPPSMTSMHQKQGIEDTVHCQVGRWDESNSLDILLSCGYGPPMVWRLYEFLPRTSELTSQLQYKRNHETGKIVRHESWAPPFGLMKLDLSDDDYFDKHMEKLLLPQHLKTFGWTFYTEEAHVDPQDFQAKLLQLMSNLYCQTTDERLKKHLGDVLRLLVVTFIMGHTLTIPRDDLPEVIGAVRHTRIPENVYDNRYISPRLANRQLKFFFHQIRNNIYDTILKNYQATLRVHKAGIKETTWLESFCIMLGFAMSLEELQRLLVIQADAKAVKGELTAEWAADEASNAISRIDDRFALLVGLFQCKYRDRTWGENGSFGPGTPELRDPAQHHFLSEARKLVEQRADHLQFRANAMYSPENQCLLTTRLTAKFLLPFLNLPKT